MSTHEAAQGYRNNRVGPILRAGPLTAGIIEAAAGEVGARAAAVGPGIGPCCFEVGPEVEAAFAGLGPGLMNGRNLDLPEVA
ncbi:laccase domain-containing protein, partial [Pseudonocardia sp. SCN 73-27]|uniref:laccase domain-containing protein n=1 Tax=Pseudonocardia sp. SCN 73-27 TaxID=1660132 RepID=UPI0025CD1F37